MIIPTNREIHRNCNICQNRNMMFFYMMMFSAGQLWHEPKKKKEGVKHQLSHCLCQKDLNRWQVSRIFSDSGQLLYFSMEEITPQGKKPQNAFIVVVCASLKTNLI